MESTLLVRPDEKRHWIPSNRVTWSASICVNARFLWIPCQDLFHKRLKSWWYARYARYALYARCTVYLLHAAIVAYVEPKQVCFLRLYQVCHISGTRCEDHSATYQRSTEWCHGLSVKRKGFKAARIRLAFLSSLVCDEWNFFQVFQPFPVAAASVLPRRPFKCFRKSEAGGVYDNFNPSMSTETKAYLEAWAVSCFFLLLWSFCNSSKRVPRGFQELAVEQT